MSEATAVVAKLTQQMESVSSDISDIKKKLDTITNSMERIARIEERHDNQREAITRAFEKIELHDNRIKTLELQEPVAQMVHKWVIAGVIGVVVMVGVQMMTFLLTREQAPQVVIDAATIERMYHNRSK